ncbi:MAG: hypothetical protein KJ957_08535, partial [Candidatus Omnitrophica bacterium]|nr:hypothetical protein [Candidatus Omnitrophota bacterium]
MLNSAINSMLTYVSLPPAHSYGSSIGQSLSLFNGGSSIGDVFDSSYGAMMNVFNRVANFESTRGMHQGAGWLGENALEGYTRAITAAGGIAAPGQAGAPGFGGVMPAGQQYMSAPPPPAPSSSGDWEGSDVDGDRDVDDSSEDDFTLEPDQRRRLVQNLDERGYTPEEAGRIIDRVEDEADGDRTRFDEIMRGLPARDSENWAEDYGAWIARSFGDEPMDDEEALEFVRYGSGLLEGRSPFSRPPTARGTHVTVEPREQNSSIEIDGQRQDARVFNVTGGDTEELSIPEGTNIYQVGENYYLEQDGGYRQVPFVAGTGRRGSNQLYIQRAAPADYVMLRPTGENQSYGGDEYQVYQVAAPGQGERSDDYT